MRTSIIRFFTWLPPRVQPGNYRTFMVFNVGTLVAMAIHAVVVPLFLVVGAQLLAVFNVLSFLTYGTALVLNRRGHHLATMILCFAELTVHQALCIHFLGWAAGFQYYLLVIAAMVFFLPAGGLSGRPGPTPAISRPAYPGADHGATHSGAAAAAAAPLDPAQAGGAVDARHGAPP